MRVVEVGQYFVTKDTGDFRQFQSVACREYTLPRDDRASQPKGWIQGNMRIGPVLEVTTSFSTSNVELKFELSPWIKTILILGSEFLWNGQNLNRENLLRRQQPYQYTKEDGMTLNHQNKILIRTISRRKSSIFFDTIRRYIEKKMEQFNSTE